MKYIETPVTPGKLTATLFEGSDILCVVDGTSGTSYQKRDDIMLALNEHDKLVAERDALVGACEALLDWNDPLKSLPADIPPTCPTLPEVIKLAEAALALVRGEGDE